MYWLRLLDFVLPYKLTGLQILIKNYFSYFSTRIICCGYSKEPSQRDGSFEHPKHMFKLMGKKTITFLCSKVSEFMFNVPPTAKVTWRWGRSLESHPTD